MPAEGGRGAVSRLLEPLRQIACDAGDTRKTLWRLHDGSTVESVLMRYPDRNTLCISSQAGCGMACPFCATGQGGLTRNLSAAEILEQVRDAAASLRDGQLPGGPVACPTSSSWAWGAPGQLQPRADGAAQDHRAAAGGVRHIPARCHRLDGGTCAGHPATCRRGAGVTLAVSLHCPDDELRDTLVPVNTRWAISEVLDAARYYADVTGRRVSIEYALIRDVNDQPWRADMLGKKLRKALGQMVHVNLIPLNPTPGSQWDASPKPVEREFVRRVREQGVSCTVRDTRGREIAAACGQLAASER